MVTNMALICPGGGLRLPASLKQGWGRGGPGRGGGGGRGHLPGPAGTKYGDFNQTNSVSLTRGAILGKLNIFDATHNKAFFST